MIRYYSCFYTNLVDIDQVVSEGEVVRVFMRSLGLKGVAVKDNHKVMPVHNPEELEKRVEAYINMEQSKDQEESVRQIYAKEVSPLSKR